MVNRNPRRREVLVSVSSLSPSLSFVQFFHLSSTPTLPSTSSIKRGLTSTRTVAALLLHTVHSLEYHTKSADATAAFSEMIPSSPPVTSAACTVATDSRDSRCFRSTPTWNESFLPPNTFSVCFTNFFERWSIDTCAPCRLIEILVGGHRNASPSIWTYLIQNDDDDDDAMQTRVHAH